MQVKGITWAALISFGLFCCPGISTRADASVIIATTMTLTETLSPIEVGAPETFTATLSGFNPTPEPVPNVTIDFTNVTLGGTDLGSANTDLSGVATLTVSFASPGDFDIQASFVGNMLFQTASA